MSWGSSSEAQQIARPGTGPAADSSRSARAGMAMSLATFAMATASGVQAVLYLSSFGIDGRTDGFFVAFGLYATFGVFSQSIRVTTVPLLVGIRARLGARELAVAMAAIGLPVALLTIPLAGPLAQLLAPGLAPANREVTESALPLLGAAMVLQLWAAGAATVLAVRSRFGAVAAAYVLGAAAGLVAFLFARGPAGELSLAWSMLAMAVVTFAVCLLAAVRSRPVGPERPPGRLRIGAALGKTPLLLARTGIYLAFNGLYVITVAFVSRSEAGDATVLSYAYLFASYLVSGTAFALGMGRIAEMSRAAISARTQTLAETVVPGYRYSVLVVAPALAGLLVSAPTLVDALLGAGGQVADAERLREFSALLVPWTVAALAVNLLLPALLAAGRGRFVNALALPLVVAQLAFTGAGSVLFGAPGAVGAFFLAPAGLAIALAVAGTEHDASGLAIAIARDTLRFGVLAAVSFGLVGLAAFELAAGTLAALVAAAAGTALYAVVLPLVAPHEAGMVFRSVLRKRARRAPTADQQRSEPAGATAALDG